MPRVAPRAMPTVRLVMQWNGTAHPDAGGLRRVMERNGEAASVVCAVAGGTNTLYLRSASLVSGAPEWLIPEWRGTECQPPPVAREPSSTV